MQQPAACGGGLYAAGWLVLAPEAVSIMGFLVGWAVVRLCLRSTIAAAGATPGAEGGAPTETDKLLKDEVYHRLHLLREELSKADGVSDIKIDDGSLTCEVPGT